MRVCADDPASDYQGKVGGQCPIGEGREAEGQNPQTATSERKLGARALSWHRKCHRLWDQRLQSHICPFLHGTPWHSA